MSLKLDPSSLSFHHFQEAFYDFSSTPFSTDGHSFFAFLKTSHISYVLSLWIVTGYSPVSHSIGYMFLKGKHSVSWFVLYPESSTGAA